MSRIVCQRNAPKRRVTKICFAVIGIWAANAPALRADELSAVELGKVTVGGEIGRRIDVTVNNNLLVLDADKDFLPPFAERKLASGYIGLGKLIDATVRFAAYSKDQRVLALKKHLVGHVIRVQDADGYVGIMSAKNRIRGMWDVHEMSYLILGLVSDYRYFGEQDSLRAARAAADYILKHWSAIPPDWGEQTGVATFVSVTGFERAMIALSASTADSRYVDFCKNERALPRWNPEIVIGRRPGIKGHIYANLCRMLAQLELYRAVKDEELLQPARRTLEFCTRGDGMAITGGCGQWEIWTDDQDGRGHLSETCATAYQVRLLDNLFRLTGDSYYGDLLERTIYNTLFAAQSPDGRRIRYYAPFEGEREYHPSDTYCCPCNFRRIIAELPTMIFYRAGGGVTVNLYTDSEAKIDLADGVSVSLRQETDYPSSGRVVVHVDPTKGAKFALRLRIPAWCSEAHVSLRKATETDPSFNRKPKACAFRPNDVNSPRNAGSIPAPILSDQPAQRAPGGRFHTIERSWRKGDRVVVEMPMPWRLVRGRQRQAGRAAVMRGPVVFCLNPSGDAKLAELDGAELGHITLDPDSFADPVEDNSVHPRGVACRVQAWTSGYRVARPGDLKLTLTEFADPGGRAAYFRLQDLSVAVDDELLSPLRDQ